MLKHQELSDPNSCLNRAGDDEPVFVLRGWDVSFITVVRAWAQFRRLLIAVGVKPQEDMRYVLEAEALCETAAIWRYKKCIAARRQLDADIAHDIDLSKDPTDRHPNLDAKR